MSAPYFTLPEFKYVKPKTLEEALKILKEKQGEAKIMNGGVGIVSFLKERLLEAEIIVDIKGIPELKKLEYIPGKGLYVGATVTVNELNEFLKNNPELKEKFRGLYEATEDLADAIIRNRGTIVGNILEGLPYVDGPGAALIFDAEMHAVSQDKERWIPVEGLIMGPMMTQIQPDEIVTEILFKEPPENARSGYIKFTSRTEYGIVNVAALIANPDNPGQRIVRIAITGATPLPYRARKAEELFKKEGKFTELIDEAVSTILDEIEVMEDPYASAEFRKHLVEILVTKLLVKLYRGE